MGTLAGEQHLGKMIGNALGQGQLDPRMVRAKARKKAHEPQGPDRAHDAKLERCVVELEKAACGGLDGFGTLQNLFELGANKLAEIGKVGAASLASEEQPAELALDLLDCPGQRRLGHVHALGGSGEIECLAYRQEIADLMHFHGGLRGSVMPFVHQYSDRSALSPICGLSNLDHRVFSTSWLCLLARLSIKIMQCRHCP